MEHFLLYMHYGKFPWEIGIPLTVELDNIFPFMLGHLTDRQKLEAEKKAEWERLKRGGQ